ncbi:bifunctional glutamate N-acetyltransferase/amino-acid acetyltransferase ArgJ [Ruminococcus sp.]|uniref:bifunctional glutamate N-acetyltransferase/amino-acid acetyltransferase ArgJ n=1 Tax=Ruminococcus sp. TaxID=41978 RepID=UPI0025DD3045|nr:bifunctional glutamate N-acetyltransferase/amino-acid acetyltransferase ArgJ [Ruminococcus sp.]
MEKIALEGYTFIDGGICAAKGFRAGGVYCGIKKTMTPDGNESPLDNQKNDLTVVAADTLCNAAAVYTQNKVKGAPVLVMQKHLKATCGKAMALVANSKNANTCNADGEEKAETMCALTAKELGVKPEEVLVMSTGVIGQILPMEPIAAALPDLCKSLTADAAGAHEAAVAIMTTDTFAKEVAVEFELGGKTCHLGGMAKGSGMIHPNMATTLNCITTDAVISPEMLQEILSEVVKVTYNCLSVDGDQSTNDTCLVMASGLAGNAEIKADSEDYWTFRRALYCVMMNLTRMLAYDGEGATKLLECTVSGAKDVDTAIIVAKSVICSPLFKCAMFGADANWGRVLCAVGYAPAEFDIKQVAVTLASRAGSVDVCKNGAGVEYSEEEAKKVLLEDEIQILVSIGDGAASATAWGCDLTYDYVKINGDYRS